MVVSSKVFNSARHHDFTKTKHVFVMHTCLDLRALLIAPTRRHHALVSVEAANSDTCEAKAGAFTYRCQCLVRLYIYPSKI